jgi:hypothetical protein
MLSCALVTGLIAEKLGRGFWLWFAVAISFSIAALCLVLCLSSNQEAHEKS